MTIDRHRAAEALAAAVPDLARVWRAARAAERRDVFPGLLDGLVEPFLALAAEALAEGRDPALLWPSLAAMVRVDPGDLEGSRQEIEAEWALVEQVLDAACRALDAEAEVREWIFRAVDLARTGARALPGREGARGILTVRVFRDLAATRRRRAPSPP